MKKRSNFFYAFLLFFFIALLIFILSSFGVLKTSFLGKLFSPVASLTYFLFHKLPFVSDDEIVKRLKDENTDLKKRLVDQKKLQSENAALRDQFEIANPRSINLLHAKIVGAPGFVPGTSFPSVFIIDKGEKDGVKKNHAVVFRDAIIGKIEKTTDYLSRVMLLSNNSFSFTAKTDRGTVGVLKGEENGKITLGSVLLSEDLKKDDFVYTRGDLNENGIGMPEDLIVGKIESVEKNPTALFQKAKVQSVTDFTKLFEVFVVVN